MTSHEYAKQLRQLAELLESRPEFKLPNYQHNYILENGLEYFAYHGDKSGFLEAVKAVGSGTKQAGDKWDFSFLALNGLLRLTVAREAVCRLVKPAQEAVYDCEPLLSQEEESSLGAA
jgi:hypothetical protein